MDILIAGLGVLICFELTGNFTDSEILEKLVTIIIFKKSFKLIFLSGRALTFSGPLVFKISALGPS